MRTTLDPNRAHRIRAPPKMQLNGSEAVDCQGDGTDATMTLVFGIGLNTLLVLCVASVCFRRLVKRSRNTPGN